MLTTNNGGVPGSNTPIEKAPGSCESKGLMTDTNNAEYRQQEAIQQAHDGITPGTLLTAAYTRVIVLMSGFTLDRGIDAYTIVMLILLAILMIQGVAQWML